MEVAHLPLLQPLLCPHCLGLLSCRTINGLLLQRVAGE